ncbi:MAG: tetratricopeptide repeat protein [Candidatus Cloacimonetes bacterium]|nr:tetratricopeptide repeat protein [Candidatus Cloacimonadota bacterium]
MLDGINKFPKNREIYLELADLYVSKNIYRKAIEVYQRVLWFNKEDQFILLRIGNCFLSLKEYSLAIDYYNMIQKPEAEMLYNKSFAFSRLGKPDDAIKNLEKIFEYNLTSNIPYILMAELQFSKRQYRKAIEYIEISEEKFGKNKTHFYLKGIAFSHLNQWLKAYMEFHKADKMHLESAQFFRAFGIANEKIGKTAKAIDLLLRSINLAPSDPSGYIELINLYLKHNRVLEAYNIMRNSKNNIPLSFAISLLQRQITERLRNDRS